MRSLIRISLMSLLVFTLAACGDSGTTSTPSPAPSPAPAPTPDPTNPDPTDPSTPDPTDPTDPDPTDPDPMDPDPTEPANQPPTVSILGDNPRVTERYFNNVAAEVSDPDGDPLTYLWEFIGEGIGTGVTISDPTMQDTGVRFEASGDYTLKVTVDDGHGGSASDTVDFIVTLPESSFSVFINSPASGTFEVNVGDPVELTTTLENLQGRNYAYQWSVIKGIAANAAFSSPTYSETDVTFSEAGSYTVQFLVTNLDTDEAVSDSVEVVVEN